MHVGIQEGTAERIAAYVAETTYYIINFICAEGVILY